MEKSANKLWKESGTTLSFKEWITRENQKKEQVKENFLPFIGEEQVKDTINQTLNFDNQPPQTGTKSVLGLSRGILVFSGFIIAGALGYYFFTKLKNKE
jgi:hypothetical protein